MAAVVLALSACDTDEGDAGHGSHAGGSGGTGGVGGHGGEAGAGGSGGTGGAGGEGGEGGSVPTVEIASIRILPGEAEIVDHETVAFSAEALDEDGNPIEGVTFAWRSSDAAIASITSDGVATGHRPGSVVITAEAEGVEGTASLRVNAAEVAEATIEPETLQLPLGEERRLVVTLRDAEGRELFGRTIAWSSTDPAIASVDEDGVVTGVDLGEAEIVAEVDGFTLRASVYVVLRFRSIHAGGYHYCGLAADGSTWCWGDNRQGQLANDEVDSSAEPVEVPGDHLFRQLALTFRSTCGLTLEGEVICWGTMLDDAFWWEPVLLDVNAGTVDDEE